MVYRNFGKINNFARNWQKSVLSMIWHAPLSILISRTPRYLEIWYGPFWRVEGWTFLLIYRNLDFETHEKKFHTAVRNFFGTCLNYNRLQNEKKIGFNDLKHIIPNYFHKDPIHTMVRFLKLVAFLDHFANVIEKTFPKWS